MKAGLSRYLCDIIAIACPEKKWPLSGGCSRRQLDGARGWLAWKESLQAVRLSVRQAQDLESVVERTLRKIGALASELPASILNRSRSYAGLRAARTSARTAQLFT
jgi:hypothetical protein